MNQRPAHAAAAMPISENGAGKRVLTPDARAAIVRALGLALAEDLRQFPSGTFAAVLSPSQIDRGEASHG